jgi:hypothetical protein
MKNSELNGDPPVEKVITDLSKENEQLVDIKLPDEESVKWRTPGFQRMRIEWRGEDRVIVDRVKSVVETRIQREFEDAYRLLFDIYETVREQETDEHGQFIKDGFGHPVWKRDHNGQYVENFNALGIKEKERLMFSLTTSLFFWQQLAADAWGEAMFAKAAWEERFSIGYDTPRSGTIDDRTAKGRLDAREERYFAVMMSWYSRKADSLVSSMLLLSQRIKDSMVV